jgi:hypothetical protein
LCHHTSTDVHIGVIIVFAPTPVVTDASKFDNKSCSYFINNKCKANYFLHHR